MDKVQIKSSPIEAQAAIGELLGLDVSQKDNKQVEFSYSSGITGMENGKEVTNQMLEAVVVAIHGDFQTGKTAVFYTKF